MIDDCGACGKAKPRNKLNFFVIDGQGIWLCADCLQRARDERENERASMSYEARRDLARPCADMHEAGQMAQRTIRRTSAPGSTAYATLLAIKRLITQGNRYPLPATAWVIAKSGYVEYVGGEWQPWKLTATGQEYIDFMASYGIRGEP